MKNKSSTLKQKQLKVKLNNVRDINELKGIFRNVEVQNRTLRDDTLNLKYKVDLLQEKQKAKNSYNAEQDGGREKELRMYQIQLKEQYKIMQELKKRKEQSQASNGTEELNNQQLNLSNQLRTTQNELAAVRISVNDIRKESLRLERTIGLTTEDQKRNEPKVNEFSSENTTLKKKIQSLKKLGYEKEYESGKVMNSMYTIKTKMNKNEEIEKEFTIQKQHAKTEDKIKKSKSQFIDVEALSRQVTQLKDQYHRKQQEYNQHQKVFHRKRDELIQDNKDQVMNQRDLDDKKGRLMRELNKYKKIWEKYLEYKNNSKFSKEFVEGDLQVDEFVSEEVPLRKQFAGIIGGKVKFDDRITLKDNKKSFMTGFMVYQLQNNATSKNSLVAIRAIYDDEEANANNQVPIPGHFLSKCKLIKYVFMEGDFIKLFKVKYQANDSRILKVQIRTNKNNRYEFGDKRLFNDLTAGQNVYAFDISITEYPVSLFGSYSIHRSHWYLESLGVEINQLEGPSVPEQK